MRTGRGFGVIRGPGALDFALPLAISLALGLSATLTVEATAQAPSGPGWQDDLAYAGVNAVLSGLVAGIFHGASEEGSFAEGFWGGATGGTVAYMGKRVSALDFDGAGLLGRQIASVGSSVVSNAREGKGPLDELTIQLGLGRLYWDRVESSVTFKPDVVTIFYTVRAAASERVRLDWSRTFSAGAPTFLTRPGLTTLDAGVAGRALGGVVLIDVNGVVPVAMIASHERTHVVQYDQQFALWAEPAERALASLLGSRVASVAGRVDLSIALLPFVPLFSTLPRDLNPLEVEADHLTALAGW